MGRPCTCIIIGVDRIRIGVEADLSQAAHAGSPRPFDAAGVGHHPGHPLTRIDGRHGGSLGVTVYGLELTWLTQADAWLCGVITAHLGETMAVAVNLLAWAIILATHTTWPLPTEYVVAWDPAAAVLAALHVHQIVHSRVGTVASQSGTPPSGRMFVRSVVAIGTALSLLAVLNGWAGHPLGRNPMRAWIGVPTVLLSIVLLWTIAILWPDDALASRCRAARSTAMSWASLVARRVLKPQ